MNRIKFFSFVLASAALTTIMFLNCADPGMSAGQADSHPSVVLLQDDDVPTVNEAVAEGDETVGDDSRSSAGAGARSAFVVAPSPKVTAYVNATLASHETSMARYLSNIDSGASEPFWSIAAHLRTIVTLYEATGDERLLMQALDHGEKIVTRTSRALNRKDAFRNNLVDAWVSNGYTCNRHYASMVHSMVMIEPVANAVRLLSVLRPADRVLGERSKRLLSAFDLAFKVFDGMYKTAGYYANATLEKPTVCKDFSRPGKVMPLNMVAAAGLAHYRMYQLGGMLANPARAALHKTRFTAIAAYTKSVFRTDSFGSLLFYKWKYVEGGRDEDSSHAYLIARFALALNKDGWRFTGTDMTRLANTFLMLYNNMSGGKVRTHLSLASARSASAEHKKNLVNFVELCRFSAAVFPKAINLYNTGFRSTMGDALLFGSAPVCGGRTMDSFL